MNETDIQTAIKRMLEAIGLHPKRNNSGAMRSHGRMVRYGFGPGSADLFVLVKGPDDRCVPVALEVKDEHGKQTPEQKDFEREWVSDGGLYAVVRSVGDALRAVNEAAARAGRASFSRPQEHRPATLAEIRDAAARAARVCEGVE